MCGTVASSAISSQSQSTNCFDQGLAFNPCEVAQTKHKFDRCRLLPASSVARTSSSFSTSRAGVVPKLGRCWHHAWGPSGWWSPRPLLKFGSCGGGPGHKPKSYSGVCPAGLLFGLAWLVNLGYPFLFILAAPRGGGCQDGSRRGSPETTESHIGTSHRRHPSLRCFQQVIPNSSHATSNHVEAVPAFCSQVSSLVRGFWGLRSYLDPRNSSPRPSLSCVNCRSRRSSK